MPNVTNYTNALYSTTNLGVVNDSTNFFSASSTNNEVALISAGSLGGSPVIGLAYNQLDVTANTTTTNSGAISALGARATITLQPYVNGVHYGSDAPTTITTSVSGSAGIPYAVLLANRQGVYIDLTGTPATYAVDLSASEYDISHPNVRRLVSLGYIG